MCQTKGGNTMVKKFKYVPKLTYFSRDELDLSALRQEFENDYKEPEAEEVESDTEEVETEADDTEAEVETEEEQLEDSDTETDLEEETEEVEEEQPRKQTKEENAAFAEMRRKQQEIEAQLQRRNSVVEKIAAQYGMSVEQFEAAYAEQQMEEAAKKEGMSVEVYKRLDQLEKENSLVKVQAAQDKYLAEVNAVSTQYGLDNAEVEKVYQYIGEQGLYDPNLRTPTISFETAYKIANFDTLLERKTKESKQADLAKKKARQKNSALAPSNASASPSNDSDYSDEFEKRMSRLKNSGVL
jgi:hypothetical protein